MKNCFPVIDKDSFVALFFHRLFYWDSINELINLIYI